MSRAFIKEDAGDPDELPERPQSSSPNYVTAGGLEALRRKAVELRAAAGLEPDERRRREIARDQKYFEARISRAIFVDTHGRPADEVRFGAKVELVEASGVVRRYSLVGQDESEEGGDKVSWDSSIGLALIGARVGDALKLPVGDGTVAVKVTAISY